MKVGEIVKLVSYKYTVKAYQDQFGKWAPAYVVSDWTEILIEDYTTTSNGYGGQADVFWGKDTAGNTYRYVQDTVSYSPSHNWYCDQKKKHFYPYGEKFGTKLLIDGINGPLFEWQEKETLF